jgi:hypothetical protein
MSAFQAFSADIESRCDEPPVAMELTLVGSYEIAASRVSTTS